MSGAKKKLTISQWDTKANQTRPAPVFTAMLNPAKYTYAHAVDYRLEQHVHTKSQEPKIDRIHADTLDLDELVLDGTGIVDAPASQQDVDGQIALLRRVLHDAERDPEVRCAVVQILWGSLSFVGRLKSMSVSYTLFSAAGTPLRARVKLAFEAYEKNSAAMAKGAAGPRTRQLRLAAGDSLPLLCFEAYNDASLSQAVALFNQLTTIRRMLPGGLLTLPKKP